MDNIPLYHTHLIHPDINPVLLYFTMHTEPVMYMTVSQYNGAAGLPVRYMKKDWLNLPVVYLDFMEHCTSFEQVVSQGAIVSPMEHQENLPPGSVLYIGDYYQLHLVGREVIKMYRNKEYYYSGIEEDEVYVEDGLALDLPYHTYLSPYRDITSVYECDKYYHFYQYVPLNVRDTRPEGYTGW